MTDTLREVAVAYQDATGCPDAQAIAAAFVAACLLARLAGDQEAAAYFLARANEREATIEQS